MKRGLFRVLLLMMTNNRKLIKIGKLRGIIITKASRYIGRPLIYLESLAGRAEL